SYMHSPVIRVIVGEDPDTEEFFVHQDLICPGSEFFQNAMNEPWLEAEQRKVTLPKEEPDTFAVYMGLLYTYKVPIKGPASTPEAYAEYTILAQLYVLAEMLIDVKTKDIVLPASTARSKERFGD
ncbi:hypothetical protein EK21DRAFT_45165, partial [Setomelanomma holmii]